MQGWLERGPSLVLDSKDVMGIESLVLLLKCLKIMENATFLSKDNQVSSLNLDLALLTTSSCTCSPILLNDKQSIN